MWIHAGTDPEIYVTRWVTGLGFDLGLSSPYREYMYQQNLKWGFDSVSLTYMVCKPLSDYSC